MQNSISSTIGKIKIIFLNRQKLTGCQFLGKYPGPSHMAQKKWNVVRLDKTRKVSMLANPPHPESGGQYMVLLNTVAIETHLMMPRATRGPQ